MDKAKLAKIIEVHGKWLRDEEGGERAYLRGANLEGANLRGVYLRGANLGGAYLEGANLEGAYLEGVNLRRAYLGGAYLEGVNLRRAYLGGANLEGANLEGASGNMKEMKSIFLDKWPVTYTAEVMQIGCQRHTIDEWRGFDDDEINNMDGSALDWWKKWKDCIFQAIELSPAKPTAHEKTEVAA